MKIDVNKIHSPCMNCYVHGHSYCPEDEHCMHCEYAITVKILQSLLCILTGSNCTFCKRYTEGCAAPIGECKWVADWEKIIRNVYKE